MLLFWARGLILLKHYKSQEALGQPWFPGLVLPWEGVCRGD